MDKWELKPLKSIGRIKLGMERTELRKLFKEKCREFNKSKFSKNTTDDYGRFHVFYTPDDKVDAVEIFEGIEVVMDGNTIFPIKTVNINKLIPGITEDNGSFTHVSKSIGFETTGNKAESILVGSKGYYAYQSQKYLGEPYYVNNGIDMSGEFEEIAKQDEKAAVFLCKQELYNQSVYYYIQSMEKYIKSFICKKIDITNDYYADRLRQLGHSLDASIDFFIEIVSGNDNNLKIQVSSQLKKGVLKDIHFTSVYNAVRYPYYKNGSYRIIKMSKSDCAQVQDIYDMLKTYINSIAVRI